jgi:hypothetical protein
MESHRTGTPNAGGDSSAPSAGSEDFADEFIREVARVGELPSPSSEPRVGHILGRFRIVAELARGGMGIVYLAHDQSLQRSVALELLRPSLSRHDERQRRFLREARAAAAVTHPNLTTIYDDAVRIAISLLAGLEQAHRAGFVHRDLKPDNVIVTSSGAKAGWIGALPLEDVTMQMNWALFRAKLLTRERFVERRCLAARARTAPPATPARTGTPWAVRKRQRPGARFEATPRPAAIERSSAESWASAKRRSP